MARCILLWLMVSMLGWEVASAQIENVIVETYYIADANDATDTTLGRSVEEGAITYRIYIDLVEGSKLRRVYGNENHPLIISSTAEFYNNIDRPTANFGYLINHLWLRSNPTLALDSWLTIGLASRSHNGVLKEEDPDSTFLQIINNSGGTAEIPGGLLANTDLALGIPVMVADGYAPNDSALGQWLSQGLTDFSGNDTTIFGPDTSGSVFRCTDCFLQQNDGVYGAFPTDNKVLIAQLTTTGELEFELNVEVEEPDGAGTKIVKYVASDDTLLVDERVSAFLTYPPACGCQDANFIEYSENFACGDPDSCRTPVIYGCTDTLACNYNDAANFPIPELCCYIGLCNDRDISVVCASVIPTGRYAQFNLDVYPNPAHDRLAFKVLADDEGVRYEIFDVLGKKILQKDLGQIAGIMSEQIDIVGLGNGMYMLRLYVGDKVGMSKFLKN